MNDPDSLQMVGCTQTYPKDDGWLVGCTFRGKSAFGALIEQSNWFTIRQEKVVRMESESAYAR